MTPDDLRNVLLNKIPKNFNVSYDENIPEKYLTADITYSKEDMLDINVLFSKEQLFAYVCRDLSPLHSNIVVYDFGSPVLHFDEDVFIPYMKTSIKYNNL